MYVSKSYLLRVHPPGVLSSWWEQKPKKRSSKEVLASAMGTCNLYFCRASLTRENSEMTSDLK